MASGPLAPTKISATPTACGLVAAQATAYAAVNASNQTAYTTAITPATRTKGAVAAKNAAKNSLTNSTKWDFQGTTTKSSFDIVFPDSMANGAQVWICAAWINLKQEAGPASVPITTNV